MDWEELENILRSRQTEPEEAVLEALMAAIGRQIGFQEHDKAWLAYNQAVIGLRHGFYGGREAFYTLQNTP